MTNLILLIISILALETLLVGGWFLYSAIKHARDIDNERDLP